MNRSNTFTYIAALLLAVVALVHVYRVFTDFQVIIGSHSIPMWVSYLGIVLLLGLAWMLCREARGRPTV